MRNNVQKISAYLLAKTTYHSYNAETAEYSPYNYVKKLWYAIKE